MSTWVLLGLLAAFFTTSDSAACISNITVVGTVFCDACSNNSLSKNNYFLKGAKVLLECRFRPNASSREDISITVERTTNQFGVYRLDIPPVDGFECEQGRPMESFCRASLAESSSSMCDVPSSATAGKHLAVRSPAPDANACLYSLNAMSYRPKKDLSICGTNSKSPTNEFMFLNSSLFFWPPFLGFPWPSYPPWPFILPPLFPLPSPPFPFPFSPPSLPWFRFPFPFAPPNPPWFPFPFTPSSPPLSLLPPLPPFVFPSPPPPPIYYFPLLPLPPLPSLPPFQSLFAPPPPPPSSSPLPRLPYPFPPFPPFFPVPAATPSPPSFSPTDPRRWFPFHPPSPLNPPEKQLP